MHPNHILPLLLRINAVLVTAQINPDDTLCATCTFPSSVDIAIDDASTTALDQLCISEPFPSENAQVNEFTCFVSAVDREAFEVQCAEAVRDAAADDDVQGGKKNGAGFELWDPAGGSMPEACLFLDEGLMGSKS